MHQVRTWRAAGDPVFYTVDAGPNVHCITRQEFAEELANRLRSLPAVRQVLIAPIGPGASLEQREGGTSG
jgi:diphosphomevalonate decarboxylase